MFVTSALPFPCVAMASLDANKAADRAAYEDVKRRTGPAAAVTVTDDGVPLNAEVRKSMRSKAPLEC